MVAPFPLFPFSLFSLSGSLGIATANGRCPPGGDIAPSATIGSNARRTRHRVAERVQRTRRSSPARSCAPTRAAASSENPLFSLASISRISSASTSPLRANQHPPAYLLGDGGDGLWCQFSGGAKAREFRDITGILDRLEDPVDDAAVVMDVPQEWLRTDDYNEPAQRFPLRRGLRVRRSAPHPGSGAPTVKFEWP
jgi:hypothetical protein